MKFEEALSLMREGVKCRLKSARRKNAHAKIDNGELLFFNTLNEYVLYCSFGYHLTQKELFGEWEVYDDKN